MQQKNQVKIQSNLLTLLRTECESRPNAVNRWRDLRQNNKNIYQKSAL